MKNGRPDDSRRASRREADDHQRRAAIAETWDRSVSSTPRCRVRSSGEEAGEPRARARAGPDWRATAPRARGILLRTYPLRTRHAEYWNDRSQVSAIARASLVVVGLAPGMHGANRSGRPFSWMRRVSGCTASSAAAASGTASDSAMCTS